MDLHNHLSSQISGLKIDVEACSKTYNIIIVIESDQRYYNVSNNLKWN